MYKIHTPFSLNNFKKLKKRKNWEFKLNPKKNEPRKVKTGRI